MSNRLVFLDVETTGVEEDDRLVQVAISTDGIELAEYFNPDKEISIDAMSICHITNEMVANKPAFMGSDFEQTLHKFLIVDEGVMIAHNAQFDLKFLAKEGLVPSKHICTLKVIHHYDKKGEIEKYNLQYLRYYFKLEGLTDINPHDAMSDVIVLEAFFNQVLLKEYTVDEMVEISSKPILYKKWMFGKHKGKTFAEVSRIDLDYLIWARKNMDLDENMLYTLNYHINNR